MNVYLLSFGGHYIGGNMLIVAETKRKAFNKAKKELKEIGLLEDNEKDLTVDDLMKIDTNNVHAIVINDGNY